MRMILSAVVFGGLFLGGCGGVSLRIEPVKAEITAVTPDFDTGVYRIDRDRNLYFVLSKHSVDAATKKPVDQIVVLRVFWEPVGGKTSLNSASLNATYRYIVMTPDAVGMYEGAGFVRMKENYGAQTMDARVVDGDLRLTESSAGFHDTLGRSRFVGSFSAELSDAATLDLALQSQREFFARSLAISQMPAATQPGTAPGTEPATAPAAP